MWGDGRGFSATCGTEIPVVRGLVLATMHAGVPLKSSRVVWQDLSGTWLPKSMEYIQQISTDHISISPCWP